MASRATSARYYEHVHFLLRTGATMARVLSHPTTESLAIPHHRRRMRTRARTSFMTTRDSERSIIIRPVHCQAPTLFQVVHKWQLFKHASGAVPVSGAILGDCELATTGVGNDISLHQWPRQLPALGWSAGNVRDLSNRPTPPTL